MPADMHLSDEDKARRHVIGQKLYRLRSRYKLAHKSGLKLTAARIRIQVAKLTEEYDSIGGRPSHPGNVL